MYLLISIAGQLQGHNFGDESSLAEYLQVLKNQSSMYAAGEKKPVQRKQAGGVESQMETERGK